ncbi:TetR/AcrR family transcriptional regulator [Kitasatospora sp. NPDC057904]|uniref:TetR/AcrR family transcriptional regulator n=1 Tax=unclassified Kitasatospora TaxID=2633591 RepID=UPI0036918B31
MDSQRAGYHHGNLREALVRAGVELAREGGPSTIVLRETARRVGVSPNAAYRHFSALPDLVDEVARDSRRRLAEAMDAELERRTPAADPGLDAAGRLTAVGEGYIRYALAEPGLFATAFPTGGKTRAPERSGQDPAPDDEGDGVRRGPFAILQEALAALDAAGLLAGPAATATFNAWAGVHGLALLLLGPYAELPDEERESALTDGVAFVVRGLTTAPATG